MVHLAGVLRPIVQQSWATFVAERSADVVDVAYLDDFLFGSARSNLARVSRITENVGSRSLKM